MTDHCLPVTDNRPLITDQWLPAAVSSCWMGFFRILAQVDENGPPGAAQKTLDIKTAVCKPVAFTAGRPLCSDKVTVFTLKIPMLVLLCAGLLTTTAGAAGFTKGREIAPLTPKFRPGDYVWKPEVSPAGPVVIVVSIPQQSMFVYRNGVRIGRSTVSTGAPGHPTPTGIFTILQKKVDHESSIYKGAKMPYMQRLTWDGIAMHEGRLPGYRASHGCARLPEDFAAKL